MRLKLLATRMGVCIEKKNQPSTEQSGSISTAGEDTQEEIQITDAPAPTIAPVASAPQIDVKSDKIAQSIEILMHKTGTKHAHGSQDQKFILEILDINCLPCSEPN